MTCKEIKKDIICLYYNDIEGPLKKRVERHIKKCDDCRTFFSNIRTTLDIIDKNILKKHTSKYYIQGIYEKIEKKRKPRWSLFKIPRFVPAGALLFLILIIGIIGGIRYRNIQSEKEFQFLIQNYEVLEQMDLFENIELIKVLDFLQSMEDV